MSNHPDNKLIYDENWEHWFDQKVHGPASRWLRWLIGQNLAHCSKQQIAEVLDVGCGQGTATSHLATMLPAAMVTGIDFSSTGITAAKSNYRNSRLSFIVDESSASLTPASFDLVTAFEVLEHVPDWETLLGRMCSASRHYVMLSFPTGRMRKFEVDVGHVRNFRRGEVEAFMKRNGFRPVNLFYAGFPFYSPIYRELCNLTNAGTNQFASGTYGWRQKAVSEVLYTLFRHLSLRHVGDQFCGLFERR